MALRDSYKKTFPSNQRKSAAPEMPLKVSPLRKTEALTYLQQVHQFTHLGSKKLQQFLQDQDKLYPLSASKRKELADHMTKEVFTRFGLPKVIGSDNGLALVAQVSQGVARILEIDWKLHCACRPQSSGQVENKRDSDQISYGDWLKRLDHVPSCLMLYSLI